MKAPVFVLVLLCEVAARAGMPALEMPEVLVENLEKTPAGWVATVTGLLNVVTVDPTAPDEGRITPLYADKARMMVPVGNQLYALSMSGAAKYEARMKSVIGTKQFVQVWGARLTIDAGRVVEIVAGDVSLLRPRLDEAAFDIGRLMEIRAH
jgi:hypothetical protein